MFFSQGICLLILFVAFIVSYKCMVRPVIKQLLGFETTLNDYLMLTGESQAWSPMQQRIRRI
jgi:hypothetical protein